MKVTRVFHFLRARFSRAFIERRATGNRWDDPRYSRAVDKMIGRRNRGLAV